MDLELVEELISDVIYAWYKKGGLDKFDISKLEIAADILEG